MKHFDEVKQKKFIEYGLGVEQNLQCSSISLKTAIKALKAQVRIPAVHYAR